MVQFSADFSILSLVFIGFPLKPAKLQEERLGHMSRVTTVLAISMADEYVPCLRTENGGGVEKYSALGQALAGAANATLLQLEGANHALSEPKAAAVTLVDTVVEHLQREALVG